MKNCVRCIVSCPTHFPCLPGRKVSKTRECSEKLRERIEKNASTIPNRNGQTRSASAAADPFYRYHRFINTFQTFPAPLCPTKPRSQRVPGTGKLSFSRCILAILTLPYDQRVETSVKVKQSKRWRENEETRTLFALLPSSLTGPEHTRNSERTKFTISEERVINHGKRVNYLKNFFCQLSNCSVHVSM